MTSTRHEDHDAGPREPKLLILIPAYNEEDRIRSTLATYGDWFRGHYRGDFEIVVVLNGCEDRTLEIVQRVARDFPEIRALNYRDPIGKGGALIEGLRLAPQADLVGYVDADGSTGPEAFHRLVRLCRKADCVVGSRWLPGAVLHRNQSVVRRFASRAFHAIVQCLFWLGIKDTQCPAKVLKREAVERIHSALLIADLAFDVNLLYALKRAGCLVREVPTEWTDKIGSKVSRTLFRSSLIMFLSVVRLRLFHSPFYRWMEPLRPIEAWVYKNLRAPFLPRPVARRGAAARERPRS